MLRAVGLRSCRKEDFGWELSITKVRLKANLYKGGKSNITFTARKLLEMPLIQPLVGSKELERIKRTKRSKNDQKPTRNERDKNKSEETARNQKPDQPDTARKAVKGQNNEAKDQL
ncbi:hypothetical protein Tco_0599060 [Tanacetum coccineum]